MQTCFDSSMAAVAKRLRAEAKMTSSAVHPAFNSQEVWQHQLSPEQTECKRNTESVRKLLQQSCKVDLLWQFPWSQIGNHESPMTFVGILPLVDSGDASFKLYWTKMPQIRQIRQGTGPTASGLVAAPGSRALPGWFFPQNFLSNRSEMGWNFDGSTCFTMFHLVSTTSAIAARVCAASSCELPSVIFMKLMYLEAGDWWDWWDWDWKHLETMAKYGKKDCKIWQKDGKAMAHDIHCSDYRTYFDHRSRSQSGDLRSWKASSATQRLSNRRNVQHIGQPLGVHHILFTFCLLFNMAEAHTATIKFQSQLQTAPPA